MARGGKLLRDTSMGDSGSERDSTNRRGFAVPSPMCVCTCVFVFPSLPLPLLSLSLFLQSFPLPHALPHSVLPLSLVLSRVFFLFSAPVEEGAHPPATVLLPGGGVRVGSNEEGDGGPMRYHGLPWKSNQHPDLLAELSKWDIGESRPRR